MKEIYEMKGAGRSIRGITDDLGVARNTVRRYLKSPEAMRPNAFGVLRRHGQTLPFFLKVGAAGGPPRHDGSAAGALFAVLLPRGVSWTTTAPSPSSWWSSTTSWPPLTSCAWRRRWRELESRFLFGCSTGRHWTGWGRWAEPGLTPRAGNWATPSKVDLSALRRGRIRQATALQMCSGGARVRRPSQERGGRRTARTGLALRSLCPSPPYVCVPQSQSGASHALFPLYHRGTDPISLLATPVPMSTPTGRHLAVMGTAENRCLAATYNLVGSRRGWLCA